jgi:ATP-dependent RNA helicase RhlE
MSFHSTSGSRSPCSTRSRPKIIRADADPAQAIPTVLTGRDLLGIAQTGTGKTAAFMLPSLDRLAPTRAFPKPARSACWCSPRRASSPRRSPRAPHLRPLHRLSVGVIFGGVPNHKSVREVARGLDVLVATPGRLLDLIDQRALDLRELEILVLDEADQMLDLGFIHALKRIVAAGPPSARPCSSRRPCRRRSRSWPTAI